MEQFALEWPPAKSDWSLWMAYNRVLSLQFGVTIAQIREVHEQCMALVEWRRRPAEQLVPEAELPSPRGDFQFDAAPIITHSLVETTDTPFSMDAAVFQAGSVSSNGSSPGDSKRKSPLRKGKKKSR